MRHDDLYTPHADTITQVAASVCRRHRLPADQAEEFTSRFHLKLVDDDYAVLRRFQGRSSLRTYLVAVAERLLLDWRISEWGKWRPCVQARRLGPVAMELDRLLTRDRIGFDAAVEVLRSRGIAASREELAQIQGQLAERVGRRLVDGERLDALPATHGAADAGVEAAEVSARASQASRSLARALATLPPQDQVILRLRYQEGLTVGRIAEIAGEDAKPLYRRFDRLLAELKARMEQDGITADEVGTLFGHPAVDLPPAFAEDPGFDALGGTSASGPSRPVTTGGTHD
ncbi:MAG: sigma-70 family RNA polymerase sigma factor [Vicinamibacterales bacterium]|nr:sigma-70 family RNA polymerase sigma factor [Vicinamibacterales bacterium]